MKSETTFRKERTAVALLIVLLSVCGILASYWYGLGWFFLFQTIREFVFATPGLYLLFIQITAGNLSAKEENLRLEKNRLFTSPSLARRAFFSLALTILIFWKANIPLYRIIEMIRP